MTWLKHLKRYLAERQERNRLLLQLDEAMDEWVRATRDGDIDRRTYGERVSEAKYAMYAVQTQIDHHQTKALLRLAIGYGLPIPSQIPFRGNEDWDLRSGMMILNVDAQMKLRREVALERDIRQKPFLSWAAFAISVVSLCISSLNAIFG